jgi:hypothetical protein
MQGGGQFQTIHTSAGLDYVQQRAHDEMRSAQRANGARRGRARHRGEHLSWLHLGRRKHRTAHAHGSATETNATTATSATSGAGAQHGPAGRGESHGY